MVVTRSANLGWGVLIVTLLMAPSLFWALRDVSVWPWDPAWYGEVTVGLYFQARHDPQHWLAGMLAAFGSKPPFVSWFGQLFMPFARLVGGVEPALLLSILVTQGATLALVYRIGLLLTPGDRLVPLAGTLFTAAMPLFAGMSHNYFAEPVQTLTVIAMVWLALVAHRLSLLRLLTALVGLVSLGLLAKSTTPLYMLVPGLVCLWVMVGRWRKLSHRCRSIGVIDLTLLVLVCVIVVMTGLWYAYNYQAVIGHMIDATMSDVVLNYGRRADFITKLGFWLNQLQGATCVLWALEAGAAAFVGAAFAWWIVKRRVAGAATEAGPVRSSIRPPLMVAVAALAQVTVVLAAFSVQINEETRFLLAALPLLVVAGMASLAALRSSPHPFVRPLAAGITGLAVTAGLCQFLAVQAFAFGLSTTPTGGSPWLAPAITDPRARDSLTEVVRLTCPAELSNRYVVIGVERPNFNANSAAFYAEKWRRVVGYRCSYTSLGYAEQDIDRAMHRLDELNTSFFVTFSAERLPAQPDAFNQVSRAVLEIVARSPRYQLKFETNEMVKVFRRADGN